MSKRLTGVMLILAGILSGCSQSSNQGPYYGQEKPAQPDLVFSGTVHASDLDGCTYLICNDDYSKCYVPAKLDTSLQRDGEKLKIRGAIRNDLESTCMAGQILEVQSAQEVNE